MNLSKFKAEMAKWNSVYTVWDALFIVVLAGILLLFSETGNLDVLWKLPFITIYVSYLVGRFVGEFLHQRKEREKVGQV